MSGDRGGDRDVRDDDRSGNTCDDVDDDEAAKQLLLIAIGE